MNFACQLKTIDSKLYFRRDRPRISPRVFHETKIVGVSVTLVLLHLRGWFCDVDVVGYVDSNIISFTLVTMKGQEICKLDESLVSTANHKQVKVCKRLT